MKKIIIGIFVIILISIGVYLFLYNKLPKENTDILLPKQSLINYLQSNLECDDEDYCFVKLGVNDLDQSGKCINQETTIKYNEKNYECSCTGVCNCPKGDVCNCLREGWDCWEKN